MGSKLIVDADSGEVLGQIEAGDRIYRKEMAEKHRKEKERKSDKFVKLMEGFYTHCKDANANGVHIGYSEMMCFFVLAEHMTYNSLVSKTENNKPLTRHHLVDLCGFSYRTIKVLISNLITAHMIAETKIDGVRCFSAISFL